MEIDLEEINVEATETPAIEKDIEENIERDLVLMRTNILEIGKHGTEVRAKDHILEFYRNNNALVILDPIDVSTPFQITTKFLEEFEKRGLILPSHKDIVKEEVLTSENGAFQTFFLPLSNSWQFPNFEQ